MIRRLGILVSLPVLAVAGCVQDPEPPPEIWRVVSIDGAPLEAHAVMGFGITDGVYTGQGPCNRFNGTITTEPYASVILSAPVATRMACSDLDAETRLLAALGEVIGQSIGLESMTLITSGGSEIVLERI